MTEFWNNYINAEPGLLAILLRLLCAMLVGVVIGLEREYTHRPAGLRTHILVALGACVVSITGQMLFAQYSDLGSSADPARLSAQVITGVGFLGAGTIMKEGATVKGLTTAASVWAVACLGIAAGYGYYALTIAGMVFILITLTVFEAIQHKYFYSGIVEEWFILDSQDISVTLSRVNTVARDLQASVYDLSAEKIEGGHRITFRTYFSGRRAAQHRQRFFDLMASAPEVRSMRQSTAKNSSAVS